MDGQTGTSEMPGAPEPGKGATLPREKLSAAASSPATVRPSEPYNASVGLVGRSVVDFPMRTRGIFMRAGLVLLLPGWLVKSQAATLKIGDKAPDFALPDQHGTTVKLSDFRGKRSVVLAFYIRAFTPG